MTLRLPLMVTYGNITWSGEFIILLTENFPRTNAGYTRLSNIEMAQEIYTMNDIKK